MCCLIESAEADLSYWLSVEEKCTVYFCLTLHFFNELITRGVADVWFVTWKGSEHNLNSENDLVDTLKLFEETDVLLKLMQYFSMLQYYFRPLGGRPDMAKQSKNS